MGYLDWFLTTLVALCDVCCHQRETEVLMKWLEGSKVWSSHWMVKWRVSSVHCIQWISPIGNKGIIAHYLLIDVVLMTYFWNLNDCLNVRNFSQESIWSGDVYSNFSKFHTTYLVFLVLMIPRRLGRSEVLVSTDSCAGQPLLTSPLQSLGASVLSLEDEKPWQNR